MSAPSTPPRGKSQADAAIHRLEVLQTVFSPSTAHMVSRHANATTVPPTELLEQCAQLAPSTIEAWRNKLSVKMTQNKADAENANQRLWGLQAVTLAWTDKKQEYVDKIDECDQKLSEIDGDIQHHLAVKEAKTMQYEEDGKLVKTCDYLLNPDAPKVYRTMPIQQIRVERGLEHQGLLPDNQEKLYKILWRLWNLGLVKNVDFRGTKADETTGFKGLLIIGSGTKPALKARIIQYLQIPPAPPGFQTACGASGPRASSARAEAPLVVDPPSPAVERATLKAQIAMMQARLAEMEDGEHEHEHPPAAHPQADDDNEHGSKPSSKKRQRSDDP